MVGALDAVRDTADMPLNDEPGTVREDLAQIARETAEDYRTSLESQGLRLAVHTSPDPLWVEGDPVRLAQMLGNLLTNAGRFNNPGGHIGVQAGADLALGMAVVRVTDTGIGIGIDRDMMARLFDPFEQAAQDLARSRGGLGLGLTLVRQLVELHRGEVTASSPGLGKGSTFSVRLPLLEPLPKSPAQAPASLAVPRASALARRSVRRAQPPTVVAARMRLSANLRDLIWRGLVNLVYPVAI